MVSPEDEQQTVMQSPAQIREVRQQLRSYVRRMRQAQTLQNSMHASWQDAHRQHQLEIRHPNRLDHRNEKDKAVSSLVSNTHRKWEELLANKTPPHALLMQKHHEELVRMQRLQWAMLGEERRRQPPNTHEQWVSLSERHDRSWEGLRRIQQIEWERLTQLRYDVQMVVCLLRHSMSALRLQDLLRRMRRHMQVHQRRLEQQIQTARSLQKKRELRNSSQRKHQKELQCVLLTLYREQQQAVWHRRVLPRYMHKFGQQLAHVQAWLQQQQKLICRWWEQRGWCEGRGVVRRLGPIPAIGHL